MLKVMLIDKSEGGSSTIISGLSLCRDKQCTEKTITDCMEAKPVPHLAALEMSWYCFLVEGLSVKARIQLERHRMFSSIERSTRALDMGCAEYVIPETIQESQKCIYLHALNDAMEYYNRLIDSGEKKENAAYVLPLGVTTRFQLSGNGRVFFEYLTKRLCKRHVQREHFRLAGLIYSQLEELNPVFKYAVPCGECGKCGEN